jgi:3-oxoacyl-[acyl-carrier-protein] synthase II
MDEHPMPSERAVVVTGIGSVSALGVGGGATVTAALARGVPAVAPIRAFSTDGAASHLGGEVGDVGDRLGPDEARRLPRVSQFAVVAARLALADAGLEAGAVPALGIVLGSHWGDFRSSETFASGYLSRGPLGLSPLVFPSTVMNAMGAHVAMAVGARGPMLTLNQPGGAAEAAIVRATAFIVAGRADVVLAGGVDELCEVLFREIARLGITSPADPGPEGCRPFDRRADGTVRGEGATLLVLEALPAARTRGARIYAVVEGAASGGIRAPAYRAPHNARRDPAVIRRALVQAGRQPGEIGAAYLTGSGSPTLDACELDLLEAASRPAPLPPVTALTPFVGDHAGLGALRVAVAATVTLGQGRVPALPDLRVPVRPDLVPSRPGGGSEPPPRGWPGGVVLVHGLAPGGSEAAVVLGPAGGAA